MHAYEGFAYVCLQLFTTGTFGCSTRHGVTERNPLQHTFSIVHIRELTIVKIVEPCGDIYGIVILNQNIVQNLDLNDST